MNLEKIMYLSEDEMVTFCSVVMILPISESASMKLDFDTFPNQTNVLWVCLFKDRNFSSPGATSVVFLSY